MTNFNFTDEDWKIIDGGSEQNRPGIDCCGFAIIVYGEANYPDDFGGIDGRTPNEKIANARLIAQAPKMAHFIAAVADYLEEKGGCSVLEYEMFDEAIDLLSKVIDGEKNDS